MQEDKDVERISGDQLDVSRHRPHCRGSEQPARNSHVRNTDQTLLYFLLCCGDLSVCDKHVRLDHINADIWKNSFPPDPLLTFAAGVTLISARRGKKESHNFHLKGSFFHSGVFIKDSRQRCSLQSICVTAGLILAEMACEHLHGGSGGVRADVYHVG